MSKVKKSSSKKKQIEAKKKRNKIIASVVVLLLLLGGGVAYKYMSDSKADVELSAGDFLPEGKDAKEMSKAERDKAAQDVVDESAFILSILPEASFPDGKSKGNIYIRNEVKNAYPISVEVIEDETGDVIYESGAIEPGYEITEGTLTKDLAKGKYKCTAKVSIYDPKTKEYKGQTAAEMEVEVKG